MTAHNRASRYISWALRHAPSEAGLRLDADGWVSLDELVSSMRARGYRVDEGAVHEIVTVDAKGRYAISADGQRIRANYGHSVDVRLLADPAEPPDVLYHGTARHSLDGIRRTGLLPQARLHVHLCDDVASAISVGARHGRPCVIKVDAKAMHADGLSFYPASKHVWLTEMVPTQYLDLANLVF